MTLPTDEHGMTGELSIKAEAPLHVLFFADRIGQTHHPVPNGPAGTQYVQLKEHLVVGIVTSHGSGNLAQLLGCEFRFAGDRFIIEIFHILPWIIIARRV